MGLIDECSRWAVQTVKVTPSWVTKRVNLYRAKEGGIELHGTGLNSKYCFSWGYCARDRIREVGDGRYSVTQPLVGLTIHTNHPNPSDNLQFNKNVFCLQFIKSMTHFVLREKIWPYLFRSFKVGTLSPAM
jgi:hypothetical protein